MSEPTHIAALLSGVVLASLTLCALIVGGAALSARILAPVIQRPKAGTESSVGLAMLAKNRSGQAE